MMTTTHSYSIEQKMDRGEQLTLLKSYSRFLKLRKSGFPSLDARNMTGLNDEDQFSKAQEIYKSYM